MTGYNGRWRCDGGQKTPNETVNYPRGKRLGRCESCGGWFRLYSNGKLVMHKSTREERAQTQCSL